MDVPVCERCLFSASPLAPGDVSNLRQIPIDRVPEVHVPRFQILLHGVLTHLVVDFQVVTALAGVGRPVNGHLGIPCVGIAGEKRHTEVQFDQGSLWRQQGWSCLAGTPSAPVRLDGSAERESGIGTSSSTSACEERLADLQSSPLVTASVVPGCTQGLNCCLKSRIRKETSAVSSSRVHQL